MPHSAGAIRLLQELLREIKQHLHSDACPDRYTQPRATDHQPSMIRTSSPISKIKRHATDVAAAVVHGEKKSAGQVGELRLCTKSNIETDHHRPKVDRPPLMPVSGDATILRTRSWVSDGRKPASARRRRIQSAAGRAGPEVVCLRGM